MKGIVVTKLILVLFLVLMISGASAKETINVVSYITNSSIENILTKRINSVSQSKVLSLFEVRYQNFNSVKDFIDRIRNRDVDIVVCPVAMKEIVQRKISANYRYWNEYFSKAPTFYAVYKTYTFDFMKKLSYDGENVEFLPLFAYSFYYDSSFPNNLSNLNVIELLTVYDVFSKATDYVSFYLKYIASKREESYIYPLNGTLPKDNVKILNLNEGFIRVDTPCVVYGVFVTNLSADVNKINATNFLATKIWDFETQIDLTLEVGVLCSDKNTTLHPGFVQKLKDKRFSLLYNSKLGKLTEYKINYNLFNDVILMILNNVNAENIVGYLNSFLYSPLVNTELLYSSYSNLIIRSGFRNYVLAVFSDKMEIKKLVYSNDFINQQIGVFEKVVKHKNKQIKRYQSKKIYDIIFLILNEDKRIFDIENYGIKVKEKNPLTIIHTDKKQNLVFIKRKTPNHNVVLIAR
ncbi:MAG: hypothetical protein ABDH21_03220 [bacterium]